MRYTTIEQDFRSGLALLRDGEDPPRYYIRQGRRLELIAIGNENAARSRFGVRCSRARQGYAAPASGPPGTMPPPSLANYRRPGEALPQQEIG
jgi:hypothetical protein